MSLWLMAAALEHQTRSQQIRAICAEAMRIPAGPPHICMHAALRAQQTCSQNGLALLLTVILFFYLLLLKRLINELQS